MPGRSLNADFYGYSINGQKKTPEIGPNTTTAEFWQYDARIGRRWNVDPKPDPSISKYACFANSPIFLFDPFGDTTFVTANQNGTYKVTGGTLNDNHNGIYIKGTDEKIGEMIGYSATPESFYNSDAEEWMGTINPNDQSGRDFLNKEILGDDPNLVSYMRNARPEEKLDFKRSNGTNNVLFTDANQGDYYRGMPLSLQGEDQSKPVFGSARDVGNIAAGAIAGRAGLSWSVARYGFDYLETKKNFGGTKTFWLYPFFGVKSIEGSSTQYGQKLGFRIGSQIRQAEANEKQNGLPGYGYRPQIKVSNSIIVRNTYTPWK